MPGLPTHHMQLNCLACRDSIIHDFISPAGGVLLRILFATLPHAGFLPRNGKYPKPYAIMPLGDEFGTIVPDYHATAAC